MFRRFFKRLSLSTRFSFKYTKDKLKLPFALYSESDLYSDLSYSRKIMTMSQTEDLKPICLAYVGKPEDILGWKVDTDFSQGGNSAASLELIDDYCT